MHNSPRQTGSESFRLRRGPRPLSLCIAHCALSIAAAAALSAVLSASQAPPPATPLDVLLPRMFAYVEQFMRDFGGMVSEEQYVQSVRQATGFSRGDTRRELKSDFLLVN